MKPHHPDRRLRFLAIALFGACSISGCATTAAVPKMQQADSAAIGISLRVRPPIKWPSREPYMVYFVKTDAESNIRQVVLLRSSYATGGRVYFLNLTPGSYAAVVAVYSGSGRPDGRITRPTFRRSSSSRPR